MTVGTSDLVLEIHIATIGAFDDVTCNLYATTWAYWSFVADLVSAFWTFYDCHGILVLFINYYLLFFT